MSEHFVKHINIEKYKGFSDFFVEGFKRVNLISGKNNVGKTALMEALLLSARAESAPKLFKGIGIFYSNRYAYDFDSLDDIDESIATYIKNQARLIEIQSNLNSISFDFHHTNLNKVYDIKINEETLIIPEGEMDLASIINDLPKEDKTAVFIPNSGLTQKILIDFFTDVQIKDREPEIYKYVKSLDETIENVKIIGGNSVQCKVIREDGNSDYQDINEFGDGLRQFLTTTLALFGSKNSYVCIDELGNGVHYSSFDKLWEVILLLSKELNIQVFATTHSKECIESYCRVSEKLKDEDISFITLVKNKEKVVKAIVRDYELFTSSIHDEHEVRGW